MVDLAAELDGTIRALKVRLGEIGEQRLTVMASLTLLDRLRTAEATIAELSQRADRLERARERAVLEAEDDETPIAARIDALTEAVERLTAGIHAQVRASRAAASEGPSQQDVPPASFIAVRPGGDASPAVEPAPSGDEPSGTDAPDVEEPFQVPSFMRRRRPPW